MKKISLIALTFLFLASCTTMQKFQSSDVKEDGIRYKYGADKGVKVGDTIVAYKKVYKGSGKGTIAYHLPVGNLSVISVQKDYAIMKKDGEFEIKDGISFDRK